MNAATRELFRLELIKQLAVIGPVGAKTALLKVQARAAGFEPTDAEIDAELAYLDDKGLVAIKDKAISPELKRWRITAEGRDYAAQEGLA